jgi:hypothetical protein
MAESLRFVARLLEGEGRSEACRTVYLTQKNPPRGPAPNPNVEYLESQKSALKLRLLQPPFATEFR